LNAGRQSLFLPCVAVFAQRGVELHPDVVVVGVFDVAVVTGFVGKGFGRLSVEAEIVVGPVGFRAVGTAAVFHGDREARRRGGEGSLGDDVPRFALFGFEDVEDEDRILRKLAGLDVVGISLGVDVDVVEVAGLGFLVAVVGWRPGLRNVIAVFEAQVA
jgi:hypothetical protein